MSSKPPTLLVTKNLPPRVTERAASAFTVRMPGALSIKDWLATASEGADAILCTPGFRFDAPTIASLPASIKVIGTFSVGYDHIDVAAARSRGIAVVNTPDVLNQSTAEFAMLMLLAAARRLGEGERMVRAGQWQGWTPADFLGREVSGAHLGIFGMGRIGQALARIARAGFGMQVSYHNRTRLAAAQEEGARFIADEAAFLAGATFLCLFAPGGPATQHWLNADRLARLPAGCVVINPARGTLVDDEALAAALRSGHVAAAALDVFPREPRVPEVYMGLENVVLTPHIASATNQTRDAMGFLALDGIEAVLAGRVPANLL